FHKRQADSAGGERAIGSRERRGHQKGGEHLAAGARVDGNLAAGETVRVNPDRKVAVVGFDFRAETAERVEETGHRALAHRFDAVDLVGPFWSNRAKGGQEARGGAGVPDEEAGLAVRNFSAETGDRDRRAGFIGFDLKAELAQG